MVITFNRIHGSFLFLVAVLACFNLAFSNVEVREEYLECVPPITVYTHFAYLSPADGGCDSEKYLTSPKLSTHAHVNPRDNECYNWVMLLLTPEPTEQYKSITVKMGYFQDISIARALVSLASTGVKVTVDAGLEENECSKKVKTLLVGKPNLTATWHGPQVTWESGKKWGIYHPKMLQVIL
ncbi:MAG: hypothetical protein J0G29_03845 [Alphaproteobacteria bacterium]|nr:hypothetical protein [Alphaproteobacteria bacterium]OJV45238.1 MAG: hypothetical protein BGO28_00335 [Alphaproteobacteria bacterium 43-37]